MFELISGAGRNSAVGVRLKEEWKERESTNMYLNIFNDSVYIFLSHTHTHTEECNLMDFMDFTKNLFHFFLPFLTFMLCSSGELCCIFQLVAVSGD